MTAFDDMREWAEAARDYPSVHAAAIDYLFAPGESYDDTFLEKLYEVYEFVERLPCSCTTKIIDEYDGCERCLLLNRQLDVYVGRGR